jgi:signal transduction histidine kinase
LPAERRNTVGKVSDLNLDADLQKKSEVAERNDTKELLGKDDAIAAIGRGKRREQTALPEPQSLEDSSESLIEAGLKQLRISTFESEIDPFEFSLLDSGHFVLFRKVWRDGERYTQGVLFDRDAFIQGAIGTSFRETSLSDMSNLIVAYQDNVIRTFSARDHSRYSNVSANLGGELLYRNRLSAPFGSLELVFSITQLPAGPGASVLGWVTLILAIVFVAGFVTLYRLGLSQIGLARQQQDFVSAVSHELKSPLTSIRMYGEMLKEGWADEDKRQSYYEFIHDESERLSRLISNVLQLASITRNEPQFDIEAITVAELMNNTESKVSSQIERAGYELTISRSADADSVTINMDEDCFAQIIINLVDNAIKFSKDAEKKKIEISSCLSGDGYVLFSVRDYGPGIEKGQMKKIFQFFYRSESELTRETVGTGIGLAIVHQLTTVMNGVVDLINVNPGAEFRLRFPIVN